MTRRRLLIKSILGLVILAGMAIGAARITAQEPPKKIRIIYTDDMAGAWLPCG